MEIFKTKDRPLAEKTTPRPSVAPERIATVETVETPAKKAESVKSPVKKPESVTKQLRGLATSIKGHQRRATAELLSCGQCLAKAQAILADHHGGTFTKFIKEQCGMSPPVAYRVLRIWEVFGGCVAAKRLADPDALRKLATGPANAIVKATAMMDDGRKVDLKTAKQLVFDATPKKDKPETFTQHVEVPGLGMIVIKSTSEIDPYKALMAALRTFKREREAAAA